jgi:hypothetical protein
LTTVEVVQFTEDRINKLRTQYPGEVAYWSVEFKKVLVAIQSGPDIAAVPDHLHNRLPKEEFMEWLAFDQVATAKATDS